MTIIASFISNLPILKYIDGWKSAICLIMLVFVAGLGALDYIDLETTEMLRGWLEVLFGASIMHKVAKVKEGV